MGPRRDRVFLGCDRVVRRCDRVNLGAECCVLRAESRTVDWCASTSREGGITRGGIRASGFELRGHATGSRARLTRSHGHAIELRHPRAGSRRPKRRRCFLSIERIGLAHIRQSLKASSDIIGAFATGARPNDTTSSASATTFGSNETTSSSLATAFLRLQSLARLMPFPPTRPARAGCVSVLSYFHHHHECRDARPSFGRCRRRRYERGVS